MTIAYSSDSPISVGFLEMLGTINCAPTNPLNISCSYNIVGAHFDVPNPFTSLNPIFYSSFINMPLQKEINVSIEIVLNPSSTA